MSVNKLEYHAIGARGARGGVGDSCGGATVSTPELDRVRGSRSLTALRRSLSAPKMSRCGHAEFAADPAELIDWPGPPHLWIRRVSRSPASKGHAMARPTERPACSALARQRKSEDPS